VLPALLAALALSWLGACASTPPIEDVPSAETYYRRGEEILGGQSFLFFFSDVDYDQAIELFQEVIDNYPYSEYATLAELRIADIHFDQENYEEALSYYQDFVELHPNHPRVPYAIFRNGLCAFEQIKEPDRDQTTTYDAIAQFEVLLDRYPDWQEADRARHMLIRAQDQLVQRDVLVGDFYMDHGDYYAALRRYRRSLSDYPRQTGRAATMARLADALLALNRHYEAEQVYTQVVQMEPGDAVLDHALEQLDEIRLSGANGGPPLVRSCVTDPNPACAVERDAIP
jgi:outer membrane protein assembly factor BamD